MNETRTYKLILVSEIHKYEAEEWSLINDRVHCYIGGWASVYMVKKVD